jgi:hypothetical protein
MWAWQRHTRAAAQGDGARWSQMAHQRALSGAALGHGSRATEAEEGDGFGTVLVPYWVRCRVVFACEEVRPWADKVALACYRLGVCVRRGPACSMVCGLEEDGEELATGEQCFKIGLGAN